MGREGRGEEGRGKGEKRRGRSSPNVRDALTPLLSVCNGRALFVGLFVCLWVCYHDNSKSCASISPRQTGSAGEGSDHLQLIKFWRSCTPREGGLWRGENLWLQPARSVCVSLSVFFSLSFFLFWVVRQTKLA